MDSDKLQQPEDEKNPSLPEVLEDENCEVKEDEQENLEPQVLPKGCAFVKPCPTTGNPIGCIVCS